MAIAIRPIPTLYGEDAERFERLALEAEKRTAKLDITDNIRLVKEFLKKQPQYLEVIDYQLFVVNTVEKWIGCYLWVYGK